MGQAFGSERLFYNIAASRIIEVFTIIGITKFCSIKYPGSVSAGFLGVADIHGIERFLSHLGRILVHKLAVFQESQLAGSVEYGVATGPIQSSAGIAWISGGILCAADHYDDSHFGVYFSRAIFFFAIRQVILLLASAKLA
jgi:hypothetical protein